MEEPRQVEYVRPEEDPTRRASPQREAEEPLERGRLIAAPEPPGVADLGGGGEEYAGEDGGGEEGHGEAMDGRDGSERDWTVATGEEEEEVEED